MRKNSLACASCWKGASDPTVTAAFYLDAIAQTSAVQIVDCLVEGALIAIFARLLLAVIRRQNSGTRFAVWFSALMAIAVLPLFGGLRWSHGNIPAATVGHPPIMLPGSWALYVVGAWAAIAAWSLLGVGRGLWHLHILRKSCIPVDTALLDVRLQETLERNQSKRPVRLYTSDLVHVPTAVGFVKPLIVIPGWVMQELSPDELNQILLHELAHLRRWDDWTNLAQKVVKALFFFHPAVWWIEKRVSLEREMACDDAVLAETASPRAYAECLAHLAEKTLIQRGVALAQAALGRIRQTSLRVAQILDVNRPPGTGRAWKLAVSLVAGFAIVCVLGISRAPQLIAFSDNAASLPSPMIPTAPSVASGRASTGMAIANARASNAVFQPRPRIVPTSVSTRAVHRTLETYERTALILSPTAKRRAGSTVGHTNIRLSNADVTPVAFTETLLVVIDGSENGFPDQPVYQIQLWRVTVLHPVVDSNSNRIPRKEI
jgi:beta-lactamase regulating signal transducer with metallopeptidase domain